MSNFCMGVSTDEMLGYSKIEAMGEVVLEDFVLDL
ncbi:hypothetical protein ES702_01069 [subsurface metagenome]